MRRLGPASAVVLALAACDASDPATVRPEPGGARPPAGRVEIVPAPPGEDAAAVVRAELERATGQGRRLVVYVGATWCEPCTRFHDAAAAGQLDATFPTLRMLEFDHDRDAARLEQAGYKSKMIPLFAIPGPDGRGSGRQIEGSVKGDRAVGEITPRLQELLASR